MMGGSELGLLPILLVFLALSGFFLGGQGKVLGGMVLLGLLLFLFLGVSVPSARQAHAAPVPLAPQVEVVPELK